MKEKTPILGALLFSLMCLPVSARPVILDWDASPAGDGVVGYRLFYSSKSFLTPAGLEAMTTGQAMADPQVTKTNIVATTTITLPSLAVNTTYYFRLAAYDAAGNLSAMNVDGSVPPKPTQVSTFTWSGLNSPVLVSVRPVSCHRVVVNWQDTTTETGYKVQRTVGTSVPQDIATLPANTTYFVDLNLASATAYSYQVVATAGLGSATSNVISTTTRKTGDVNGGGVINVTDLSMLLYNWGTQDFQSNLNGGLPSGDNIVNVTDLTMLLYNWGK